MNSQTRLQNLLFALGCSATPLVAGGSLIDRRAVELAPLRQARARLFVGSGVARDAAMRGLSVALVDRHDFAFGTSSRSSRLLHGGLRYLAQGRVGLVHEASVEKVTLHRIRNILADCIEGKMPKEES